MYQLELMLFAIYNPNPIPIVTNIVWCYRMQWSIVIENLVDGRVLQVLKSLLIKDIWIDCTLNRRKKPFKCSILFVAVDANVTMLYNYIVQMHNGLQCSELDYCIFLELYWTVCATTLLLQSHRFYQFVISKLKRYFGSMWVAIVRK